MTRASYLPTTVTICLAMVMAAALLLTAAPRAEADDTGKVLGAIAAGYLTYQLLDRASSPRCGPRPCPPSRYRVCPRCRYPAPRPRVVQPRYVAPEIDLHRYRFGYPPSQIDPYRRYYRPPATPGYSLNYGRRMWGR